MASRTGNKSGRGQFGPDDWIRAAQRVLESRCIDAVRVEVLAKEMGVTKGSFYWHFKDRDDLLQRMLTAWRDVATEQIIFRFESRGLSARELIHDLISLPFRGESAKQAAATELAIRAWSRRDESARNILNEVDAKRLSYIAECFRALGFSAVEAKSRAFVLYSYELSESLLSQQGSAKQKDDRRTFIEKLLTTPLNSEKE
ncbi:MULTISPECIES: TetR/AcrR family transcriptional regulator [unclassified Burkholderia]|uniref:TetR/AcrR family transcriptional regulator n=1 Tax=unclassified Burkholderia TaxID=2613784 RepID=UPI000F56374A|nr:MULTISPECIES: TetR/AcrR family transcriptional regulator [unclassified Burkholderia]RQR68762.1 TetR/AcrR family transcriptional regulator [Burkholderia sp. Bp9012]RQR70270.1 TetR/AcrR family transcriptional regulator [Burkholderia sp. Bp9011]RQR83016.1 TetR/AcrR family transcriptional regulator [Burkholderia sp. Bp9010]RQZ39425.1 TetR/AcrR family transcriptional regulator [Burkholderia sp. Bp9099]